MKFGIRNYIARAAATALNQLHISDKKPCFRHRHTHGTMLWDYSGVRPLLAWQFWFLALLTNKINIYKYPSSAGWIDKYIITPEGLALRDRFYQKPVTETKTLMPPLSDAEVKPLPLIHVTVPKQQQAA